MEQSQTPTQDLYPTQVQAAALLAAGHSLDQVCQDLSIGRSTLYRWRQTPDFSAYLHQLLRTHADESLCQSVQLLSQATARIKASSKGPATAKPTTAASPAVVPRVTVKTLCTQNLPIPVSMDVPFRIEPV